HQAAKSRPCGILEHLVAPDAGLQRILMCLRAPKRSAALPDGMGLFKDDRLDGCSILEHCVFAERIEPSRNYRGNLSRAEEDMFRYLWAALEPVRIVKCSSEDTKYLRKSLKIEE